jgi:hypothetical protein
MHFIDPLTGAQPCVENHLAQIGDEVVAEVGAGGNILRHSEYCIQSVGASSFAAGVEEACRGG